MNKIAVIRKAYGFLLSEIENGLPYYLSPDRNMSDSMLAPPSIFTSMLLLGGFFANKKHLPTAKRLLDEVKSAMDNKGHFHFFGDKNLLPSDMETTSYGLTILLQSGLVDNSFADKVLSEMVQTTDNLGRVKVYFEPCGKFNPLDHVSAVNILFFASTLDRIKEFSVTKEWVQSVLESKEYLFGSRYYHSPDAFLYFFARLVAQFPNQFKCNDSIVQAVLERLGTTINPLDMAMRLSAGKLLGVFDASLDFLKEEKTLIELQNDDGSFPSDGIFHYGRKVGFFGSKGITTSFALEALFI